MLAHNQFADQEDAIRGIKERIIQQARVEWGKGKPFTLSMNFDTEGVLIQGLVSTLIDNRPIRGFSPECLELVLSIKEALHSEYEEGEYEYVVIDNPVRVVVFSLSDEEKVDPAYYEVPDSEEEFTSRFITPDDSKHLECEISQMTREAHLLSQQAHHGIGDVKSYPSVSDDGDEDSQSRVSDSQNIYKIFEVVRSRYADLEDKKPALRYLGVLDKMKHSTEIMPFLSSGIEVYHMSGSFMYSYDERFQDYHILQQAAYNDMGELTWVPQKVLKFSPGCQAYQGMKYEEQMMGMFDKKPIRAYLGALAIGAQSSCMIDNLDSNTIQYIYGREIRSKIDQAIAEGQLRVCDLDVPEIKENQVIGFTHQEGVQRIREKLQNYNSDDSQPDSGQWSTVEASKVEPIGIYSCEPKSIPMLIIDKLLRAQNLYDSSARKISEAASRNQSYVPDTGSKVEDAFMPVIDTSDGKRGIPVDLRKLSDKLYGKGNDDKLLLLDYTQSIKEEIARNEYWGVDRNEKLAHELIRDMGTLHDMNRDNKPSGWIYKKLRRWRDRRSDKKTYDLDSRFYILAFKPLYSDNKEELERIIDAIIAVYEELGVRKIVSDRNEDITETSQKEISLSNPWLQQFAKDMGKKNFKEMLTAPYIKGVRGGSVYVGELRFLHCTYRQFKDFEYKMNEYRLMAVTPSLTQEGARAAIDESKRIIKTVEKCEIDEEVGQYDDKWGIFHFLYILLQYLSIIGKSRHSDDGKVCNKGVDAPKDGENYPPESFEQSVSLEEDLSNISSYNGGDVAHGKVEVMGEAQDDNESLNLMHKPDDSLEVIDSVDLAGLCVDDEDRNRGIR